MASKQRSESQPPQNLGGRPSALKPGHFALCTKSWQSTRRRAWQKLPMSLIAVAACVSAQRQSGTLRAQGIIRLRATRRVSPTADKVPRKTPKWHSSIQISPVGRVATGQFSATESSYSTVSEARDRAFRIARFVIDDRPDAAAIGDKDLSRNNRLEDIAVGCCRSA